MSQQLSLRERNKRKTRALIAATAMRLFSERGFEHVTVTEVADAADVSRKTVFNYFPAKDDLVLGDAASYEQAMLTAVRQRRSGESAVAAFGRFLLGSDALLADEHAMDDLNTVTRTIVESPALRARAEMILSDCTASMAALLGAETAADGDEAEPWIAAIAMIGVYRTLIDHVRRRCDDPCRTSDVRARGTRALVLLEAGLAGYAVKPVARSPSSAAR